jgi:hypothetical protein
VRSAVIRTVARLRSAVHFISEPVSPHGTCSLSYLHTNEYTPVYPGRSGEGRFLQNG